MAGLLIANLAQMTPDQFRKAALALPDVVEMEHNGHPDFRVGRRIFASLGPDGSWAMVKLSPPDQTAFVEGESDVFEPFAGAWGRQGCTRIHLERARLRSVRTALRSALDNVAASR